MTAGEREDHPYHGTMLGEIVASVRSRLPDVRARRGALQRAAEASDPPRDFKAALTRPGLAVIAEIKRRSPSAGMLAGDLDPPRWALRYEEGGAAAISVLTEPDYFAGSLHDLEAVRDTVGLPLLRKDFIVEPAQVWEARAHGADAVLLIVAILSDAELAELMAETREAGMAALVEAHTAAEADRALSAGADVIGVNNRDLTTFVTDLATAEAVAPRLGPDVVRVAESGVSDPASAARMAIAGYDAILVGEALVRSEDPAALIAALRSSP